MYMGRKMTGGKTTQSICTASVVIGARCTGDKVCMSEIAVTFARGMVFSTVVLSCMFGRDGI